MNAHNAPRLWEGGPVLLTEVDLGDVTAGGLALHVHPDEPVIDVFQALTRAGFSIIAVPDGHGGQHLCVAKPWRVEALKRQRETDRRRAAMTAAERAADDNAIACNRRINDEMSRS